MNLQIRLTTPKALTFPWHERHFSLSLTVSVMFNHSNRQLPQKKCPHQRSIFFLFKKEEQIYQIRKSTELINTRNLPIQDRIATKLQTTTNQLEIR